MRRLPDWTFPAAFIAFFVLILIALLAVGDGRGPNDHASEVSGARILLAEEEKWLDYGVDGLDLVEKGRQECAEASYLCGSIAAINEETGTSKMEKSTEEVKAIRATLQSLDPAAVEEAEE